MYIPHSQKIQRGGVGPATSEGGEVSLRALSLIFSRSIRAEPRPANSLCHGVSPSLWPRRGQAVKLTAMNRRLSQQVNGMTVAKVLTVLRDHNLTYGEWIYCVPDCQSGEQGQ